MTTLDHVLASASACIKGTRFQRGFSLQDVADRSGVTKAHVWTIEAGKARNPSIGTLIGISRALGVSIEEMMGLTPGPVDLHPGAMRIACDVDALLRRAA